MGMSRKPKPQSIHGHMHLSGRKTTHTKISPIPNILVEADMLGRFLMWGICWGALLGDTCKEWGNSTAWGKKLSKALNTDATQDQPDSRRKRQSRNGSTVHTEERGLGLYPHLSSHWLPEASSSPTTIADSSLHNIILLDWGQFLSSKVQLGALSANSYSTWGLGAPTRKS